MLHPFERFKAIYIPKLLETGRYWLVSQTYNRYIDHLATEAKASLLLTDYADENMAQTHLKALANDKYAAILWLQHPPHKAKLMELLEETSRFHVFWAVVKRAGGQGNCCLQDEYENLYSKKHQLAHQPGNHLTALHRAGLRRIICYSDVRQSNNSG
jgi:hypothetical protein